MPRTNTAHGNGEVGPVAPSKFRFQARSGPDGEDPSGTMSLETNAFRVDAQVTCLAVEGNIAGIVGDVTSSQGIDWHADKLIFRVQDNGPAADHFAYIVQQPPQVEPCAALTPPPHEVIHGNIVVKDAQP